jgi:nicotinamide mononucleotide (NMN) deamidase PncC
MKRHLLCTWLFVALTSSGCGGGGGSSSLSSSSSSTSGGLSTAAEPELEITAVKTFRFTWSDVNGATHYKLLENPDGVSGFSQAGDDIPQGEQTVDHVVPLYRRMNAQYLLQSCDDSECIDSETITVSGSLASAIGYIKASNTGNEDQFGYAVSLSADGDTLAVGAYQEDSDATGIGGDQGNNDAADSGAVYVFARDQSGTWNQQAYLKAGNTEAGDSFGYAVSLSADGNTLAVGAWAEASNATGIGGDQGNNDTANAGAVYVFVRDESDTWSQQAYIKASNTEDNDNFGFAVSLSADGATLAVGAFLEDSNATGIGGDQGNNDIENSGAVYVFVRDESDTWSQQAYIKASNTGSSDGFGRAVGLSADGASLAVGAWIEDSNATGIGGDQGNNNAAASGAVYMFVRDENDIWSQQAYVKASNTGVNDRFGFAISLSAGGDTLAVAAPGEDSDATGIDDDQGNNNAGDSGAVYVFVRSGGDWSQRAYVKAGNTEANDGLPAAFALYYAISLSADGATLAVGAVGEDSSATGVGGDQSNNSVDGAGAVYLY